MIPISVASMPLLEVKESYIMGNKVIELNWRHIPPRELLPPTKLHRMIELIYPFYDLPQSNCCQDIV